MRIYKYIHACLLIEKDGEKILIDPGSFSFMEKSVVPEEFQGISAVIITHAHADHVDVAALKTILKNNNAVVISNTGVEELLKPQGIAVNILEEGSITIGKFDIEATTAPHEKIMTPAPQNTAYTINKTLLHPGDSLSADLLKFKGIAALALPVIAPWSKQPEVVQFVEAMQPKIAVPIHDGFVKDFFRTAQDGRYADYLAKLNITYRPLNNKAEFVEI